MKTQLVIFGLTGDLGQRKLLPALDWLLRSGEVQADNIEIIVEAKMVILLMTMY